MNSVKKSYSVENKLFTIDVSPFYGVYVLCEYFQSFGPISNIINYYVTKGNTSFKDFSVLVFCCKISMKSQEKKNGVCVHAGVFDKLPWTAGV